MARKFADETTNYKLGVHFSVKDIGVQECDGKSEEVITIEGYANFSGNHEDGDSCCFIDRTNDVVVPSGIDIGNYKKSPVLLFQHDRDCVIGKALEVTKRPDGLYIKAEIHAGATEPSVFYAIKNGLYTSFSIGFRTKAGEWREINDMDVYFITKSELLEVSVVSIPCNTNSTFNVVKSLDGNIMAVLSKPVVDTQKQTIGDDSTMKVKLRDLLAEAAVKNFEALGLSADLDVERDIDTKTFVEALMAKQLEAFRAEMAEKYAEKAAPVEEVKEAEVEETEEATEEVKEVEVAEVKEDVEAEVKEDVEAEVKEADVEAVKSLAASVSNLKALFEEK